MNGLVTNVFTFLLELLNLFKSTIKIFGKLQNLILLYTLCFAFVFSLNQEFSPSKISGCVYKSKHSKIEHSLLSLLIGIGKLIVQKGSGLTDKFS